MFSNVFDNHHTLECYVIIRSIFCDSEHASYFAVAATSTQEIPWLLQKGTLVLGILYVLNIAFLRNRFTSQIFMIVD